MELLIRSQDKMALAKFDLLILEKIPENNDKYMFIADHYKNMGVYETKERALEVLDEIQNLFKPPMIIQKTEGVIATTDNTMHIINPTYGEIKELSTIVYEMPKE